MKGLRIGYGFDVHVLAPGRALKLGGIRIPHTHGAQGHSDADVLLHALCDALLGALALGDIGQHFPNTDPKYKEIDSRKLLEIVYTKVRTAGYVLVNMDALICLEEPILAPFIAEMRKQISLLLQVDIDRVSIKATTGEQIGFVGRKEGLAAQVAVLITQQDK